ncbi:hypothetical protein NHX12_021727, partial [Muraenolepis orangiensis]
SAVELLQRETDRLAAKMEKQSQGYARTKERLEGDLARGHRKYRTGEVRRLNEEVRGQQEAARLLRAKVSEGEDAAGQKEQHRQQLRLQLCASQQQVRSQAESISRLTSDLEAVKAASHKVEAEHWRQHSPSEQTAAREREAEVTALAERAVRDEAGQRQAAEMAGHAELVLALEEDLKEAAACALSHQESAAIFKQKYAVAMEKARRLQGQADRLEEELRYAQQQLRDSRLATSAGEAELCELEGRYREKSGQWESSQEALGQLTDELRANQGLLRASQGRAGQCEGLVAALRLQTRRSHQDGERLSLLTDELRQLREVKPGGASKEKSDLERSLVASHRNHLTASGQQEQEVTRLAKEVTRLKLELTNSQIRSAHIDQMQEELRGRWAEELRTARREAERLGQEAEAGRAEVQRLQEALGREEGAAKESQGLKALAGQLSRQLEELRVQHRQT